MFNILFLYIKPDTSRAKPMYLCSEPARANNCSFSFSLFFYFRSFHLSGERPFVSLMIFFLSIFQLKYLSYFILGLSTFQTIRYFFKIISFHLSGKISIVFFLCFKVFPPFRWKTFCISFDCFFSFFQETTYLFQELLKQYFSKYNWPLKLCYQMTLCLITLKTYKCIALVY